MKEYKVETLGLTFKSRKEFNNDFQALIDQKQKEGYTLHSFSMHRDFCVAVFERDNDAENKI